MSILDIIILVLLFLGAFKGYRRGFLLEIIAIVALIVGIIGGLKLLHLGMQLITEHTNISGPALPYVTFILIFVLIIILVNLLGKALKKVLDMTLLGNLDDIIGALVGILKWAFALSALFWITSSFQLEVFESWATSSKLYAWIVPIAPSVIEWLTSIFPFISDLFEMIQEIIAKAT